MSAAHVDTERRRELCAERVTLNGRPAIVGGVRKDHATVTALDNGESYAWAWPTVARIVGNGGAFRS